MIDGCECAGPHRGNGPCPPGACNGPAVFVVKRRGKRIKLCSWCTLPGDKAAIKITTNAVVEAWDPDWESNQPIPWKDIVKKK